MALSLNVDKTNMVHKYHHHVDSSYAIVESISSHTHWEGDARRLLHLITPKPSGRKTEKTDETEYVDMSDTSEEGNFCFE